MFQLFDLLQWNREDSYTLFGLGCYEKGRKLVERTSQNERATCRVLLYFKAFPNNRSKRKADLLLPVNQPSSSDHLQT